MKHPDNIDCGSTCSSKRSSLLLKSGAFLLALVIMFPQVLYAVDAENCLMCHRFRGLARVDKNGDYRLFYVDETLFNRGPHARVTCKGCHADIDKIPHDNAKPVDCLRSCHIEEPTREIIFTHEKVRDALQSSIHASTSEDGTPRKFSEDFPECKDCHDIPLFRPVSIFKKTRAGVSERAINRCNVCHTDENFVRYFYSHVTTRLHKSRDPREVVNMCASCHGDPAFARRHGLSDVISSYLETYHGKATLFGSTLAPDCLDCHAGHNSVHEMRAATDPNSGIYPENRSATCNTQDCHHSAGPALASFDVHANRNPRANPLEFGVGLFFVIATLGILLPILTMNVLGLVRELLPSHQAEKEIERLTKLAEKKAAREGGLLRFTGPLRLQHAFLIVVFVILCLTGFPMKFPNAPWAPVLYDLFGGINGAPIVHRIAGVALLVGFAFHIILILLNVKRSMRQKGQRGLKDWIRSILALPMIPKWRDLKDLVVWAKYVFFLSPQRPAYGHFSWKEKLEYLGLFWGIPLLGVTGILLWAESISTHILPGWALNVAYLAHTYESLLAVAHIALVHIPGVIGRPGVSPFSSMILNGKISPSALVEEHAGEVQGFDMAADGGLMSKKNHHSKRLFLVFYVTMWSVLLIGAATWLTIYLVGTLGDPLAGKGLEPANAKVFDSVLALTNKKVVRYLGEWEFLEPKLPGHFHHIGRWYQSDKSNFCIDCHGPIPHSRSLQERAFLNMHNLFISCQVCHVRESESVAPDHFGWVDITTGRLCSNPDIVEGVWGEYGAKIVPLTNHSENPQPVNLKEEEQFAAEFRKRMNNLNDSQKVIGNKFIHRKCIENPVKCSDCHNTENEFLSFTALGYSEERAAFLVSAEVVDLVKRYETFYMPNLLKPQQQEEGQSIPEETP